MHIPAAVYVHQTELYYSILQSWMSFQEHMVMADKLFDC